MTDNSVFKRLSQTLNPNRRAIRNRLLSNPYYRLRSRDEIEIALELGLTIDVNRASVDDWLRLPGISIHQARSLVDLAGMGVQLLCPEDLAAALSIPIGRLHPFVPLLDFCYYDPDSLALPQRLNPNTATVEQLGQIPILPPPLARHLVENRLQYGAYRNLADLQQRLALNNHLTEQLMNYLRW
ncbi:ComEA family DNA-binding protein [Lusitaniella coriacea LEGE 07157]|uniref:ComEA family DNA-binding protein n=1 Tax=Lusitaniella coriacea LEGE 07157 TaxID=945747 RepID=A0A8J7J2W6_9CYAN|nr:ComEA family DNA-binding protein [Lusitaniella coriacea]MBE9116614.1 ComEA family DNA-binding protein [Lusitaniella coriacea LEGE 07157]